MERATRLGLTVSKPWGESAAYDFVVDSRGHLLRVQVKSVNALDQDCFRISAGSGSSSKKPYTARDIDVLAAYIVPFDVWYLLPVESFAPIKTLRLCPQRPSAGRYEEFREAWEIFRN